MGSIEIINNINWEIIYKIDDHIIAKTVLPNSLFSRVNINSGITNKDKINILSSGYVSPSSLIFKLKNYYSSKSTALITISRLGNIKLIWQ